MKLTTKILPTDINHTGRYISTVLLHHKYNISCIYRSGLQKVCIWKVEIIKRLLTGFMYDVRFNFEKDANPPVIIKGVPSGYSILEVALESDIELHHNCGMVCACSTCHVYIDKGSEFLEVKGIRETEFLERAENPATNSRLGCQSVLVNSDGYVEVTIPDQSRIVS